MNPVAAQQVALDNALVAPEKRLKMKNATQELSSSSHKENPHIKSLWISIQNSLTKIFVEPPFDEEMVPFIKELGYTGKCDMLAEIHTNHMHQSCRTFATVINRCISGKSSGLDRLRPSRAQILWGMFYQKNVDYVAKLWEDFMFQADNRDIKDYQKYGALIPKEIINQDIKDFKAYKTYLAFATGEDALKKERKFKKIASPLKKQTPGLEEEDAKKPKQAKKPEPAKQAKTAKKTALAKKSSTIGSGDGVGSQPKVSYELQDKTTGTNEGTDDDESNDDDSDDVSDDDVSEDDGNYNDSDDERTESDEDENPNLNQTDDDKVEEYEEEYVHTTENYEFTDDEAEYEELYKDVNVRLKDVEHKEKGKGDAEKTDVGHDDVTQETTYEQVKDDEHVTLTTVHDSQKTKVSLQSSSVSSDFATKFPNLETQDSSTSDPPKAVSDFATPVIKSTIIESLEDVVLAKSSSQPQSMYEETASLTEFELKKILIDKMEKSQSNHIADVYKELYKALVNSYNIDKDLFEPKLSGKSAQAKESMFEVVDTEMPQNQESDLDNTDDQPNVKAAPKHDWFKKPKRPSTPNLDWNVRKSVDFRPPQNWIIKIAQAKKPPLSFNELISTLINFSAYVMNNLKIDNLTQDILVGSAYNLLKGTCRSFVELEYNFEECYKAVTDRLNWNNPKGNEYLFDFSKPLPLIMDRGRQVILVGYFINNDLEYLNGGSSTKKYTTSITKTKAAKYDILGIEDTVPSLWSLKLFNLERDDIFYFGVALWMFTRRMVILKRVEDLQLGVKSYQKKLNITKPETFRSDISNRSPYTAYNNPQGIIYQYKYKRNRLMRLDELYKFNDGTLTSVRDVLHDIASNLRMDYLPKRR
nr:hypothetical protein [Tanacetum cinerariifolium]GEW02330.1 hypothetical protein [Tanacetum cinerariifolium]